MNINIQTISTVVDMPVCTSIEDVKVATSQDAGLQRLGAYTIRGWPH